MARRRVPAPTDPNVHHWERHYTTLSGLAAVFLIVFCGLIVIGTIMGFLTRGLSPFHNWERSVIASSIMGVLMCTILVVGNYRRVVAVTDDWVFFGYWQYSVDRLLDWRLASKAEAHAMLREQFNNQALYPPLVGAMRGLMSRKKTLYFPWMPHAVIVFTDTPLSTGRILVGTRHPERFLAALERVKNAREAPQQQRWQA